MKTVKTTLRSLRTSSIRKRHPDRSQLQSAGIDPELLMKVLTNPEMAKLLKALAGTIE